ncbi:unnamed protein product [Meloidogyne enterolobii]|uniref:Uncharacterized protein n=1 Tax=Meloidogyne enterolobii TaxID=390850 RepID=A0ACB0XSZ2_MELEN
MRRSFKILIPCSIISPILISALIKEETLSYLVGLSLLGIITSVRSARIIRLVPLTRITSTIKITPFRYISVLLFRNTLLWKFLRKFWRRWWWRKKVLIRHLMLKGGNLYLNNYRLILFLFFCFFSFLYFSILNTFIQKLYTFFH